MHSDDRELPCGRSWLKAVHYKLGVEEMYALLRSAVLHLLPKEWTTKPVVSSTLYQAIASLIPAIVTDTRYFETIPVDEHGFGAVVKYREVRGLVRKLKLLLEDEDIRRFVVEKAKEFLGICKQEKWLES